MTDNISMFRPKSPAAQARFAELLDQTPWLKPYWQFDAKEPSCQMEQLQADMGSWSHGEQIMAKFFVAVWTGDNSLQFAADRSRFDPQPETSGTETSGHHRGMDQGTVSALSF